MSHASLGQIPGGINPQDQHQPHQMKIEPLAANQAKTRKIPINKNKKMACVECRQQKSRCDAQELYPSPCSRCMKKSVPCVVQADYKRTYKRAKFLKIEEELESLKRNLTEVGAENLLNQLKDKKLQASVLNNAVVGPNDDDASNRANASSSHIHEIQSFAPKHASSPLGNAHGPSIIREASPPTPVQNEPSNRTARELFVELSDDVLYCTPKQLGEVLLSSQQIRELYLEFVSKYHRFLPIVDISKGPERIHRLCPILFWVMASISLRHLSTETLMKLTPLLKSALAEITISPITRYLPSEQDEPILNVSSVYSVQALLLYSFWPPLTSSLSADSSWNTVGSAIFQAIRLGLNGPGTNNYNLQQFQSESSNSLLKEHVKTWISCNIVSQTIATAFGFPSFVSFDSSVVACTRPVSKSETDNVENTNDRIPTCIKHMVEISHFEDQTAKVLNSNNVDSMGLVDPAERLPLLKVLTQQLDELILKLNNDGMDDIRKFQIYAVKVALLTYYFLDNSRVAQFELRRGLVSLYNAALMLLNHTDTVSKRDPSFIKHVPGVFVLKIWQASCIVAKLSHSSISNVIDIGAGRQLYIVAIQLALKASILKHDMAYRSSGIMRNMWQLFKALREKKNYDNLEVTIRSRMSSSVFFDCLWILREQVGMIKLNPNQRTTQNGDSTSNNDQIEDEEDEDEDYDEDVFESDENVKENTDPGTVNSETSTVSSGHKKRTGFFSNSHNAENSARRIIRTIPLDPTPISLKNGKNDSPNSISLEDIINKPSPDSNNSINTAENATTKKQVFQPNNQTTPETESRSQIQQKYHSQSAPVQQQVLQPRNPQPRPQQLPTQTASLETQMFNFPSSDLSPTNIPSLEIIDDWTSDMLWKDVDSVMNDFGFNIDDLTKTNNSSTYNPNNMSGHSSAIHPQEPLPSEYNPDQSLFAAKK